MKMNGNPIDHRNPLELTLSPQFLLKNRTYTQQYANLYFARLTQLRSSIEKAARLKWKREMENGSVEYVPKIVDIKPGVPCWVLGTVYKEMPFKPNILQDLASE
ncbi:hypothetical protein HMI55_006966, partial [Coelomomyces lativittatus]